MTLLIILLVVGYILIIAEMMLPGGVLGIMGVLCLIGAAAWGFIEFDASTGLLIVVGELISGVILIFLWVKYFFDSPFGKRLVHQNSPSGNDSGKSAASPDPHAGLLNRTGEAITPLRPSGTVRIDGKRYDVLTEGGLIERGQQVKVVKIDGTHIFVRHQPQHETSTSESVSEKE